MSDPRTSNRYVFRSPFTSSIYPTLNPDETLSLLHELNASRPPEKRLPAEILLYVNRELHTTNSILEYIKATWAPITTYKSWPDTPCDLLDSRLVALNEDARRYYIIEESHRLDSRDNRSVEDMYRQVSSADLLYRLRCCFPEINICSSTEAATTVWEVDIRHNPSGLFLHFSERNAGAELYTYIEHNSENAFNTEDWDEVDVIWNRFCTDLARLLNALFFEVADWNHRRFAYYHPAADADFRTNDSDHHYIAVPTEVLRRRTCEGEEIYRRWCFKKTSATDVSSFSSLLQDLKYDVTSRKVDRLHGTANLTTVISSALLLYRLICKYMLREPEHGNVNKVPPITSVWQIQLTHRKTRASIIFMDDRGLFDIRGSEGVKQVMSDVDALIQSLCSDTCVHPCEVVAGCVA